MGEEEQSWCEGKNECAERGKKGKGEEGVGKKAERTEKGERWRGRVVAAELLTAASSYLVQFMYPKVARIVNGCQSGQSC